MTPTDEGGAWISSGQIYSELRRIGDEVAQLRVELVQVPQLREEVGEVKGELAAVKAEVEELKSWRWKAAGAGAVLATGGMALLQLVAR